MKDNKYLGIITLRGMEHGIWNREKQFKYLDIKSLSAIR